MAVDAPAAWFWLVPLVYAATLWLRREALFPAAEVPLPRSGPFLAECYPAVTMRLSANADVVECSPQAHSMLKLDPQFLLGTGLLDRVHVADRIAYLAAVADIREGGMYRMVELRLRLPTDATSQPGHIYRPFVLEFVREQTDGGDFVAILRENSAVARLREELDAARGCAETEKIRFLATVSHELRTPLNTIIGFSDMLLCGMAGPFGNERQREYTALVRESGEHLLTVVNAILDAAALGFLGMGAQPPTPEWGTMLAEAREFILRAWWVVTLPGVAILVTVLAINLMGDGLRDALDPKLKRS